MGNCSCSNNKVDQKIAFPPPKIELSKKRANKSDQNRRTEEVRLRWRRPKCVSRESVQGYRVEMWDYGTREWTDVMTCKETKCALSNILSGMLYKFRVAVVLFGADGPAVFSQASQPFIVDIPHMSIKPYWISEPLGDRVEVPHGERLEVQVEALGTPRPCFHWIKNQNEDVFIEEDVVDITNTESGSKLTVDRVTEDFKLECVAINRLGKCAAETQVCVIRAPKFDNEFFTTTSVCVHEGDMIRVEIPMISIGSPEADFAIFHNDFEERDEHQSIRVKDDTAVFMIYSAISTDTGNWDISAANAAGVDEISFKISVIAGLPRASRPIVERDPDRPNDSVVIEWRFDSDELPDKDDQDLFLVEYFRDQWQLWLNGEYCSGRKCVLRDLIPQSRYKFRVRHVSRYSGLGEASVASEPIFIGEEKVNFDIQTSASGASLQTGGTPRVGRSLDRLSKGRVSRKSAASLDREVYYSNNDERKEVVTYLKTAVSPTAKKYALSDKEAKVYRASLNSLCDQIRKAQSIPVKLDSSRANYPYYPGALSKSSSTTSCMSRQEAVESLSLCQGRVKSLQSLLHPSYVSSVGSCLETQL